MRLCWVLVSTVLMAQFDSGRSVLLDARQEPLTERKTARVWGGSYVGVGGGRINYVLVEPKTTGRHAGMLYQHGGGQSMSNYLTEALVLAELGVTSLVVDVGFREDVRELVVNERRALDLLLRQAGVDGKRIGYVGHSYGGYAGGILTGVDSRISAFVLMGAVPSMGRHMRESKSAYWDAVRARADFEELVAGIAGLEAELFLPLAVAPVLVQCARFDTPDNMRACPEVHRLAGGPKRLTWYEDDHNFTSYEAMRDRLYWLDGELRLGGVGKVLRRWARERM